MTRGSNDRDVMTRGSTDMGNVMTRGSTDRDVMTRGSTDTGI